MFRSLRRTQERGLYRVRITAACFAHALTAGDVSLCLYDVTTLYFEAETEDAYVGGKTGLRKVGHSKERRVDPQVVVGLLVDRRGFPLEIGCFERQQGRDVDDLADRQAVPRTPRHCRHGRSRRCRDAVSRQPQRARRGRSAIHRRLPRHQGADRSGVPLPLAR